MSHKVTQKELGHGLILKANAQTVNFLSMFRVWVHNLLWAGIDSEWPVFHQSLSIFQWGPKRWVLEELSDVGKSVEWSKCDPWKLTKRADALFASHLKKLCIIKRQWRSSICLWFLILFFFSFSGNKRQDLFYLFLSSLKGIKHQTSSAQNTAH